MPITNISAELRTEIDSLHKTARDLRARIKKSRMLRQWVDNAIADVDLYLRLFDEEWYVRKALEIPRSQLKVVAAIVEKRGPSVSVAPNDVLRLNSTTYHAPRRPVYHSHR